MEKIHLSIGVLPVKIRTLLILISVASAQLNAQIELVKDINLEATPDDYKSSLVHEVGDIIYFVANNDLWKSDVEGNTTKVRDFVSVAKLMNVGNDLILFADDGTTGIEVWMSDGTEAGTFLLRDVAPGSSGCEPEQFTACDGKVFFVSTTPAHGKEVWRTDGTPSALRCYLPEKSDHT